MSRRSLQWRNRVIQAIRTGKSVNDLMPDNVKGEGLYLTDLRLEYISAGGFQFNAPHEGKGRGNQVSVPMSQKREEYVRAIAKKLEK